MTLGKNWQSSRISSLAIKVGAGSFLCYFTGWYLPMSGARFIENIGAVNYNLMANKAKSLGLYETANALKMMGMAEDQHERYFFESYE